MAETLEILAKLFTGERVDYTGRFFQLEGAIARPVPVQQPLPLHIGGAGPRLTLPLVRRFAQWWSCPSYAADRLAELAPQIGGARISVQHPVGFVVEEALREEVEATARRRFAAWGGLRVGNATELAAEFAREAALGAELFILQFHDFGQPDTLERFARDVIPAVRDAVQSSGNAS